jgi:hypothetical protein
MPDGLNCHVCGSPGVKDLGTEGYCWWHYGELLKTFSSSNFNGFGIPTGSSMIETYGTHVHPLECSQCRASWVGFPGDPCWWCQRSLELTTDWQREKVLRPPEHEVDDKARPNALRAWAERLAIQVDSGLITKEEAERAIERETRRTR